MIPIEAYRLGPQEPVLSETRSNVPQRPLRSFSGPRDSLGTARAATRVMKHRVAPRVSEDVMQAPVRVAVNGYGVIGMRVAEAVRLQDEMTLAGVADVVTDYRVQVAVERGIPIFGATREALAAMRATSSPLAD